MKTLLLNPPAPNGGRFIREGRCTQARGIWGTVWPPISLATMAAVLREAGHQVSVIDCAGQDLGISGLKARVLGLAPELILWSTGTPTISSDLGLAAVFKSWLPRVWTGVFGTHVTELDEDCLAQTPELDGIIRGEPEHTARDLAGALAAGRALDGVLGLTFRSPEGARRNGDRPFITDLDSLPMPAWELLDLDPYRLPLRGRPFLIVAPSRGCPHQCSFCTAAAYYGRAHRRRSVDSVLAEIRRDQERFGVSEFLFWADTFAQDPDYVRELCAGLSARGLRISWTANSRADTVDPELLALLAESGCWLLSFGIESASQEVLDRAAKGLRVEQLRQAVRWTKKAGIQVAGHFMLGLPGETPDSMAATRRFARELGVDFAQFYCAVPYPGAPLYRQARREGWLRTADFSEYRQERAVLNLSGLPPRQVAAARLRANREFYLRPRAVLTALRNIVGGRLGT